MSDKRFLPKIRTCMNCKSEQCTSMKAQATAVIEGPYNSTKGKARRILQFILREGVSYQANSYNTRECINYLFI